LSSQGSILLSRDNRWLFVCNAGSSEISVFAVSREGLTLTDIVDSGGQIPVSLTLRHNLLYVLNAGGGAGDKDNLTAFIFANGKLVALPDSTRALSADNTGPAQVSFTREGAALVVTERLTSLIDTFEVGDDGLAVSHKTFQSVGTTPFGFDVGRENRLFVSEAGSGSASSYAISDDGDLAVISAAVATKQTAACWLLAAHDGRFVYTANAGSGSISGYRVGPSGSLELLDANGRTAVTGDGSHPVDMAQSHDGRFLYSLANGNGTLHAFKVKPNGSLVLTDFGIARTAAAAQLTATGAVLGTASYISPEQVRAQGVDARSDIFSFGCLLFEMVTGKRPFADQETPLAPPTRAGQELVPGQPAPGGKIFFDR
jgi:6-phosphogluconolactonase (cycloisomerase 2 family)